LSEVITSLSERESEKEEPSKIISEENAIDEIVIEFPEPIRGGEVRRVGNSVLYRSQYVGIVKDDTFITQRTPDTYFRSQKGFGISTAIVGALKLPVLIAYTREDGVQVPFRYSYHEVVNSRPVMGKDSKGREDEQYILDAKIPKVPEKASDIMNLEEMMTEAERDAPAIEIVFEKMNIWIDGSGALLPGQKARYCVLFEGDKPIVEEFDSGTGNEMEYMALLRALEDFRSEGATIYSDSQLVVFQLSQKYGVAAENLRPLYEKCKRLVETRKATLIWIKREENRAGKVLER